MAPVMYQALPHTLLAGGGCPPACLMLAHVRVSCAWLQSSSCPYTAVLLAFKMLLLCSFAHSSAPLPAPAIQQKAVLSPASPSAMPLRRVRHCCPVCAKTGATPLPYAIPPSLNTPAGVHLPCKMLLFFPCLILLPCSSHQHSSVCDLQRAAAMSPSPTYLHPRLHHCDTLSLTHSLLCPALNGPDTPYLAAALLDLYSAPSRPKQLCR